METERKKFFTKNVKAVLGILLAGASLFTVNEICQQNTPVIQRQYSPVEELRDYTVMVYMNGSTLEENCGAATADIREMQAVLCGENSEILNQNVNIVVEAGGASEWELEELQGKQYARFALGENGIRNMEELEVRNMGETATLTDYINYAVQSYPAKRYGIVFWNHGGGAVGGYGYDSNFDGDGLSVSDIGRAIELSCMQDFKFEFAAFDACLMSGAEMAFCLKDKVNFMIASEELEPQDGYNYQWLSVFQEVPENGQRIGVQIADSYLDYYSEKNFQIEMSVLDLRQYDLFHEALHRFLMTIKVDYAQLGRERKKLRGFGSSFNEENEIIDLMSLLETAGRQKTDAGQESALLEVRKFLEKMIVYKINKGYMWEPCGLSVYLPQGMDENLEESLRIYSESKFCSVYMNMVQGYGRFLKGGKEKEQTAARTEKEDLEIRCTLEESVISQLAYAYLAVFCQSGSDTESYYLLGTDSDVLLKDGRMLAATAETAYIGIKDTVFSLLENYNDKNYTEYVSPVLYNGTFCSMTIRFDLYNEEGVILSVIPYSEEKMPGKQIFDLHPGDLIVPLYPAEMTGNVPETGAAAENENGLLDLFVQGNPVVIEDENDLIPEEIRMEPERLSYCYLLVDIYGDISYTEIIR